MALYLHSGILRDQNQRAIAGALVAVTSATTKLSAQLFNEDGSALANPFYTGELGEYEFYVDTPDNYLIEFYFGGRKVYAEIETIGPYNGLNPFPLYWYILAEDGQTEFDTPGIADAEVKVRLNGSDLFAGEDFASGGDTTTLTLPAREDDVVEISAFNGWSSELQIGAQNIRGLTPYIVSVLGTRRANVLDIAGWDGTGTNDMASGYQTLINQAASAGVPVDMQAGRALLGSTIVLPAGHVFEGVNAGNFGLNLTKASIFHIAHTGKGFTNAGTGAPISINNQITYRTQPTPSGPTYTPTAHDFDYHFPDISDLKMTRILTLNATKGIYMNGGRNIIREWGGQCFDRGLQIDWSYDTCDISNLHLWPYWRQDDSVRDYMQNHLQTFRLGRVDNPFFSQIFSIWHQYGFYIGNFAGDGPSKPAGTVSKLKLVSADLDIGQYAYFVAPEADGHSATFSGVSTQGLAAVTNAALLRVEGPNTNITGDFSGDQSGSNVARLAASAAGSEIALRVRSNSWNRSASSFPAIEVATGGGHFDLLPGSRLTGGNGGAVSSGNVTVWTP